MKEKEFIAKWTNSLSDAGVKKFPEEFLTEGDFQEISLPGKTLVIGEEFFGNFEVLTIEGSAVLQADSHSKAKYIVYASRNKITKLKIPSDPGKIKPVVTKYESYIDSIIKDIDSDYRKVFPGEKRSNSVVNEIFRVLNLNRY